jgi:hypothetical protein
MTDKSVKPRYTCICGERAEWAAVDNRAPTAHLCKYCYMGQYPAGTDMYVHLPRLTLLKGGSQ